MTSSVEDQPQIDKEDNNPQQQQEEEVVDSMMEQRSPKKDCEIGITCSDLERLLISTSTISNHTAGAAIPLPPSMATVPGTISNTIAVTGDHHTTTLEILRIPRVLPPVVIADGSVGSVTVETVTSSSSSTLSPSAVSLLRGASSDLPTSWMNNNAANKATSPIEQNNTVHVQHVGHFDQVEKEIISLLEKNQNNHHRINDNINNTTSDNNTRYNNEDTAPVAASVTDSTITEQQDHHGKLDKQQQIQQLQLILTASSDSILFPSTHLASSQQHLPRTSVDLSSAIPPSGEEQSSQDTIVGVAATNTTVPRSSEGSHHNSTTKYAPVTATTTNSTSTSFPPKMSNSLAMVTAIMMEDEEDYVGFQDHVVGTGAASSSIADSSIPGLVLGGGDKDNNISNNKATTATRESPLLYSYNPDQTDDDFIMRFVDGTCNGMWTYQHPDCDDNNNIKMNISNTTGGFDPSCGSNVLPACQATIEHQLDVLTHCRQPLSFLSFFREHSDSENVGVEILPAGAYVVPTFCEYCGAHDTRQCNPAKGCERPPLYFQKKRPPFCPRNPIIWDPKTDDALLTKISSHSTDKNQLHHGMLMRTTGTTGTPNRSTAAFRSTDPKQHTRNVTRTNYRPQYNIKKKAQLGDSKSFIGGSNQQHDKPYVSGGMMMMDFDVVTSGCPSPPISSPANWVSDLFGGGQQQHNGGKPQ